MPKKVWDAVITALASDILMKSANSGEEPSFCLVSVVEDAVITTLAFDIFDPICNITKLTSVGSGLLAFLFCTCHLGLLRSLHRSLSFFVLCGCFLY